MLGYKQIVRLINGTAAKVVNNIRDRMLAPSFADGKHCDFEDKTSPIHPRLACDLYRRWNSDNFKCDDNKTCQIVSGSWRLRLILHLL